MDDGHQKYLLTLSLPEEMRAYRRAKLQIPEVSFLKASQHRLVELLEECISNYAFCTLEVIDSTELFDKIAGILHELLGTTPEAAVISTSPEVASIMRGHCLQVNRLVDCTGQSLGMGARPGSDSLDRQFDEIRGCLDKRPVILVEDGSFSGVTMKTMIEICNKKQIEVRHLVMGFFFNKAMKNLRTTFPQNDCIHSWRKGNFKDWMPIHDFYPFVPNAGKVVGFVYNGHSLPVFLHNRISLCMPYVRPYGNPVEWASIPQKEVCRFSAFCIKESMAIFEEMERLNRERITLERILDTYPRVSYPVQADEQEFPHIKERILDILRSDLRQLS